MTSDAEELNAKVAAIKYWFHTIDLPHGVTTPGAGDPNYQRGASEIYFGMGVQGRSVLDVGAWDGFFSFDAERRGAADVLAVDDLVWRPDGPGDRGAFELARNALGSTVRDRQIDLPDVTVEEVGQFDIVLYNGIFYHVLDPIHQLIEMARIARHMLAVETWIDNLEIPRGVMNFFPAEQPPPGSPKGYPRSGWGPNSLLMHALLKQIGFVTVLEFPTPVHEDKRSIFLAFQSGHPFADFVARYADRARPRFIGAPRSLAGGAPAPLDAQVQVEFQALRTEVEALRARLEALHAEALRAETLRADALRAEVETLRAETKRLSTMNDALLCSTSWRVTAPIRALANVVHR